MDSADGRLAWPALSGEEDRARLEARARDWLASLAVPLQTLDALHLAVAAGQGCRLLTSDRQLALAARRLGVSTRLLR